MNQVVLSSQNYWSVVKKKEKKNPNIISNSISPQTFKKPLKSTLMYGNKNGRVKPWQNSRRGGLRNEDICISAVKTEHVPPIRPVGLRGASDKLTEY